MNWDIKGCGSNCLACKKEFVDGDAFFCRLSLDNTGPVREDYCAPCWQEKKENDAGYSSWQGRYKSKVEEPKEEPIDEPILKHLLKKWLHSTDRIHKCFCYVLAILLERNKTFSEKPSVVNPEGTKQLVYEDRDTGESYILDDPCLSFAELNDIEGQLQELMKQELPR